MIFLGSLLWNTNLSSISYDTASVVVKDIQTAILDIDNISDLLLLLTDMESLTLAGVSGRNGAFLWHHRLHANCSLKRNKEQTISEVVRSVSCLNSTGMPCYFYFSYVVL